MDPLLLIGVFLIGGAAGAVWAWSKAYAHFGAVLDSLRQRVHEAEETVRELEAQEGPEIEKRMLERMYRGR